MDVFRTNGNVAAEPYLTTAEALDHPDLVLGGDIVTIDDAVHGPVRTIGPIAELTATPAVIGRGAPLPGEHTTEVLGEPRFVPGAPGTGGPPPQRPLDGITVIEFATIIAAPLSTSMLADLGARVIKVETIDGDPYRHLIAGGTPTAKTTAGKSSICLDLKNDDGRRIARELVRTADVVVFNTRPGVAERLGLGEKELRAENAGLVYVSLTGYGRHSPGANRPATHPCAGAASGGAAFQAGSAVTAPCDTLAEVREMSRQLMRANEANPDPNTSAVAAAAVLVALLARERFGIGQAVYVNMIAANMYANADDALAYDGKPVRTPCDDEHLGFGAGYRLYRAADGWVFLAVASDAEWRRCWEAIERPDLADDLRFATTVTRRTNDAALAAEMAGVLGRRPAHVWEERFIAASVAGMRADATTPGPFFAHDAQVLANDFAPLCTHTRFGTHRRWGAVVNVNGGLDDYGAGVLAGEQTDEILTTLGRSADEIASLRANRVVASEPVAWS